MKKETTEREREPRKKGITKYMKKRDREFHTQEQAELRHYYPGNQDPHKSLQPIRSSNSRSRLRGIRDQPRNPPKYTEKRIRINFPFPLY